MNQNPKEIIETLRIFPAQYQRKAVDACLANRELMTEILLVELQKWTESEDPSDNCHGVFPDYAMSILSWWREARAHSLIVNILSGTNERVYEAMDSSVSECGRDYLYYTSCGELQGIRSILHDQNGHTYARWAALDAFSMCAVSGKIPLEIARKEVMALIESHLIFAKNLNSETITSGKMNIYTFGGALLSAFSYLHPGEYFPLIRKVYKSGFVDECIITEKNLEHIASQPEDEVIAEAYESLRLSRPDSFHALMGWWACFEKKRGS